MSSSNSTIDRTDAWSRCSDAWTSGEANLKMLQIEEEEEGGEPQIPDISSHVVVSGTSYIERVWRWVLCGRVHICCVNRWS